MYFWSWSLIAFVCARSSSSAEICLYPSECCISIFSYIRTNQTVHQRLGIVLKPLKTDINPVKFSEEHQLTYSKMPTKPIAYILLGCQQTRALPVTPCQVTVLESKQLHCPELFPALRDHSRTCSWPVPHSQRWKKETHTPTHRQL